MKLGSEEALGLQHSCLPTSREKPTSPHCSVVREWPSEGPLVWKDYKECRLSTFNTILGATFCRIFLLFLFEVLTTSIKKCMMLD